MDDLVKALRQQGMTLAQYRQDLRKQILRLKVVNAAVRARISVSDEEVKKLPTNSRCRRSGTQAHRCAPATSSSPSPRTRPPRRSSADGARPATWWSAPGPARTSPSSPAPTAEDPATKEEGGDHRLLHARLAAAGPRGDSSSTWRSARCAPDPRHRGFHVMKLLARKDEGVKPLKQIKEQLRQQLYAQEMEKATKAWLQEIRKKAHVESRL